MKRARLNPRKLLVASAGVATVNYALAAGCGGKRADIVANLVAPPGYDGGSGGAGPGLVANLVAPPPPMGGNGGGRPNPGTVANLVAPPPPIVDAAVPDAAGDAASDAAPEDAG